VVLGSLSEFPAWYAGFRASRVTPADRAHGGQEGRIP
jgi:hypothetical protein